MSQSRYVITKYTIHSLLNIDWRASDYCVGNLGRIQYRIELQSVDGLSYRQNRTASMITSFDTSGGSSSCDIRFSVIETEMSG